MQIKQYDPLESTEAYKFLSFCIGPMTLNLSFMVNHPHWESIWESTSSISIIFSQKRYEQPLILHNLLLCMKIMKSK